MDNDKYVLSIPVPLFRGGSDTNLNSTSDLKQKIMKVSEQLRVERMEQDENVAEFLKLVSAADKHQVARIKQVFAKKNQKTTQNISQLQKKLEQYNLRMKEMENSLNPKPNSLKDSPAVDNQAKDHQVKEVSKESTKDLLKDVNCRTRQHRRDKIKTIGPGVFLTPPSFFNKPKKIASLFRNKFGSADNISNLKNSLEEGEGRTLSGSTTIVEKSKYDSDDESSTGTSASADSNGNPPSINNDQNPVNMMMEEFHEIRQSQVQLADEMQGLQQMLSEDCCKQMLEDEKYRVDRLEERLNDLVDLHQHEMANLKQDLASIEERVAYQANERARDLQEVLESCHSRICKVEQQVQVVQVEGDNKFSHKLLAKAINVLLAITTLLLVCVSVVTRCITASLRGRLHLLMTVLIAMLITLIWRNWEKLFTHPDQH